MPTTPAQSEDASVATLWRLDPAGSIAEFRVPHFWGLVRVKGHFGRFDGRLATDHNS